MAKQSLLNLRAVGRERRAHALMRIRGADLAELRARFPEIVAVSVGNRSRDGRVRRRAEPVLKVWVRAKSRGPAAAIPERVEMPYAVPVASRSKGAPASRPVVLSVPTDVVQGCFTGTGLGVAAPVGVVSRPDTGCIASCVRYGGDGSKRGWLSAAHVLTAYKSTGSMTLSPTIKSRRGKSIGETDADSCWRPVAGTVLDAGVVRDSNPGAVPVDSIVRSLSGWMPVHDVEATSGSTATRFLAVAQDDIPHDLAFETVQPAGVELRFGTQPLVRYPRLLLFDGGSWSPIGGDSGSCVVGVRDGVMKLAGILVGVLDDGHLVALPAEDVIVTLRAAFSPDLDVTVAP